jgi:hypothetical protein
LTAAVRFTEGTGFGNVSVELAGLAPGLRSSLGTNASGGLTFEALGSCTAAVPNAYFYGHADFRAAVAGQQRRTGHAT